jgi:hypothetical protein
MKMELKDILSDKDIAVYSLYLLGGWQKRIHTEDVALKCYELAPSKFSWVKYPQYPDPTPTRFALEAAKKPKYGALVKGESERKRTLRNIGGWMLTADGIKWLNANMERIEEYLGKHRPIGERLPADRKLKALTESSGFRKFRVHGEQVDISHAEFAESLLCTVNTKVQVLKDRLEQLRSIAEELNRDDVKDYVDFCRRKFASLLGLEGGKENAKSGNPV